MKGYAYPETIVSADWVDAHRTLPNVRVVEVDVDTFSYEEAHIPEALSWNWASELCDTVRRDILSKSQLEDLMRRSGISRGDTVVLYGDNNNWFAAWAVWQLKIYGHPDVRLMNGGRRKWLVEGRELALEVRRPEPSNYEAGAPDFSMRALLADLMSRVRDRAVDLVDVRSPAEYSGELLAPPGLPETCQRGGHIPGARNVPWGMVCAEDGTFKTRDELERLYLDAGITGTRPIITYCRIGERSSHTWFALKYLLGYDNVENYDGSWTEWGNLVAVPIRRETP